MPQSAIPTTRTCQICKSPASSLSEYCEMHTIAKINLDAAYQTWTAAYDSISTEEFLERISNLSETGNKAKEMARHLLKK